MTEELKLEKFKKDDKESIDNVLSNIGEGDCNILYNGCERFVNICTFGDKKSSQVDSIHDKVKKMLGL